MKKILNHIKIIALIVIIGFSAASCQNRSTGGGNSSSNNAQNSNLNHPSTPETPSTPQPFNDITAAQLAANIKIGWNLGNTLDAANMISGPFGEKEHFDKLSVSELEKFWYNLVTTKEMITAIKNAGFNAIRIPVSWVKAADSNYNIRTDWMARVTEVVNYAVDNDMYIILNTHHDECTFKITDAQVNTSLTAFRKIWEQIADNFKNYNEKLIFEGLNEPRTKGTPHEWTGGIPAEHINLNKHYKVFVDVIRKSGGNNSKRILMINTYGASASATAVNGLVLPTDTVVNKLVVSIHAYEPINFSMSIDDGFLETTWSSYNLSDTNPINEAIERVYNKFVLNGVPVIIGEFGSAHKNNTIARVAHAEYYVSYAKSKGIPCFWWDDGGSNVTRYFKIFNRNNNTFLYPEILAALMKGAETPLSQDSRSTTSSVSADTAAVFSSWSPISDSSSTINSTTSSGRQRIQGSIGSGVNPYANITATPNAATLAQMKTMTSFSFMVLGDGKQYRVMIPTTESSVAYNHYGFTFTATSTETRIIINVPANLSQENWGGHGVVNFNQNNVQSLQFNPTAPGTFDLTVWDIRIVQ